MIDFDKTCVICGGMVADYGTEHGWMHIVSQYDNTDERGEDAVARQRGGSERPTNTPGWFDSRDVWHDGHAVTHTESTTESGPNYCRECSEAQGHWVRWPCSPTSRGSSDG